MADPAAPIASMRAILVNEQACGTITSYTPVFDRHGKPRSPAPRGFAALTHDNDSETV
jgi:hypothetical protein